MSGLVLEHIGVTYGGITALADVSLTIAPGETLCLLGPSGSGKTSCLKVAAGLIDGHRGRVLLNDRLLAGPKTFILPEKRRIGLVQQELALFPHLTVGQNVAFGLKRSQYDRVQTLLDQVGLGDRHKAYPHELSGGQQQRVALARTLAPRPEAILFDEAFSALDVTLRQEVRTMAQSLLRESGAPAMVVTHDPDEALQMADRIAVMRDGQVVQIGAPEQLRDHPIDAFVMSFFHDLNRLECTVADGQIETPFGALPIKGWNTGTMVEAVFPADSLSLNGSGIAATVLDKRPAKTGWRMRLAVPGLTSPLIMVTAEGISAAEGSPVTVAARFEDWRMFAPDKHA